jgi:cytochrome P450
LLSPEGLRDPYAVYSRFRAAEAAGQDIGQVVVRYDQVLRLLGDRRLSSERVDAILAPLGSDVREQCPFVARADGEADLHRAYSYPLPALVVGAMLGIPETDLDRFKSWALDIVFLVGSGAPTAELAVSAQEHFGEMREYLGKLVHARRRDPGEDLLSAMIGAADHDKRLSEDEIFSNATFLMTAGHETATNMLSNAVVTLLRHPGQLERLRSDRSLISSAAEEILRFESPVQMTSRRALEDGEYAGRRVKAGDNLQLFLGAANRDPARFRDPDRFDTARTRRHVAFAYGPHYCLGAALAREELRIALDHLLDRLPGLELAVGEVAWQPTIDFRGPLSLPVRWRVD